MNNIHIIGVHDHIEWLSKAVDYFSLKWNIDRRIYQDCISHSIQSKDRLPKWYLMLDEDTIIGSYGIIMNDFISRQDLYPWLCALYVDPAYRGKGLGGRLLEHGRKESVRLGYPRLYLCTDLEGFYEHYGWSHIADGIHPWGEQSKIFTIESEAVAGR